MAMRRQMLGLALFALASMAAKFQTANFVVTAATDQIARQVGEYAERYRKEKSLEWLGQEMKPWGRPCPLKVTITPGAGGATTFAFDRGAIWDQEMNVQGSLERVLSSVLPHEVTHTVLAYHFRCPLPRWADEGSAVLSEDDAERGRHDELVRKSLATGRAFRLRVLFDMKQYPESPMDIMTLYAEGYSLVRFLVEQSDRLAFLKFLDAGMKQGWDAAVKQHYGFNRVEDLEEAWLKWMRGVYRPVEVAKNGGPNRPAAGTPVAELRRPTGQPVIRGASPDEPAPAPVQPAAWPRTNPTPPAGSDGWSPVRTPPPGAGPARLLRPEPER